MSFSKTSLGFNGKKYTHNMSYDCNTTFPFGVVQPIMSQIMLPKSKLSFSGKQLLRLSPLVLPTFGRVFLRNDACFVPISEICPNFEALLSEQPYSVGTKTYYPDSVPYTTNQVLVYLLMTKYCQFSVCQKVSTSWYPAYDTSYGKYDGKYFIPDVVSGSGSHFEYSLDTLNSKFRTQFGYSSSVSALDISNAAKVGSITYDNADYVISLDDSATDTEFTTYVFFRLTAAGRRLRSNLVSLGYGLGIHDNDNQSILPMLAYYKAYYDLYAVQRSHSWMQSDAYALIRYCDDNDYVNLSKVDDATAFPLFVKFIDELANTWYVAPDDYVSAHRPEPVSVTRSFETNTNGTEPDFISNQIGGPGNNLPQQVTGDNLNNVVLQAIQRVTRFVNKDSVIGAKISDWVKVHYGADVSNSLFKESYHFSKWQVFANINDVFSTSDTADPSSGNGELLGAYAGKGIGDSAFKGTFKNDVWGYVIILSVVVPVSGYFQGNDPTLYAIDRNTIPYPDYDALGYELTPANVILPYNDMWFKGSKAINTTTNFSGRGFGFLPRYSGFKVKKNVVSGDMSRRGSIDSFCPYYLDRILSPNVLTGKTYSDETFDVNIGVDTPPAASEEWRYPTRYPWLGDYNRMFYNSGSLSKGSGLEYEDELIDDNFICQTLFDVRVTNSLKPISDSYDTFEESTDNGSTDVKND